MASEKWFIRLQEGMQTLLKSVDAAQTASVSQALGQVIGSQNNYAAAAHVRNCSTGAETLTKELQASADDAAHAPGAAQQGADGKPRDDCAGGSGNILDALQYVFGAAYECGTPRKKQNEREDCTGRTRKN